LLGDLFLLDETPHRAYILELAEKMPESFGLSVAFAGNTEEIAGTTFARCSDLFSIDLVSTPAANPDGLFSRRFDVWQKSKGNGGSLSSVTPELKFKIPTMNPEMLKEIAALIDEKINAAMTSYEAKLSTLKAGTDAALSNAKVLASELAEKSTAEALKQFSKSFGQSPGTASAPSAASAAPVVKHFEDLVRDHSEYSKSKTKAIRDTISKHGAAYENYLSRVQNGKEIILF
jgi:ribosomal protein L12E/L44/L45/RPP1/RPP2